MPEIGQVESSRRAGIVIVDEAAMDRALIRMAHEIVEETGGGDQSIPSSVGRLRRTAGFRGSTAQSLAK